MTNKPMLSVERELLEVYTGRKEGDWVEAGHELRALLDKPACSTCNGSGVVYDGELTHSSGGIPFEMGPIKCVKDCPDCSKPATQHQGAPVAWLDKESGAIITAKLKPLICEGGFEIPLYAEQPAPVAAVPEGWQMVPVAPTDDMIVAFAEAWYSKHDPSMLEAYHDMLVVAPTYPRQQ